MKVTIQGPNLNRAAAAKGTLHVHAAGCQDNRHYGDGKYGGEPYPWTVDVETKTDAILDIYGDQINEGAPYDSCRDDVYFAPCVAGLPEGEYKEEA